ncbi:MAG: hypothetical protein FJZ97_01910, partial [Chloroflexi bacterium]|nr:hypothetical protein [Chloroflexota bacterium]
MASKKSAWKKGPGKMGVLSPLLGTWKATADSPLGRVTCTRTFSPILGGTRIQLSAKWKFARETYEEMAIYGVGDDKAVHFWSFTSDGKRS